MIAAPTSSHIAGSQARGVATQFDWLRFFEMLHLTTPKANATTERAPSKEEAFPVDDFFFFEKWGFRAISAPMSLTDSQPPDGRVGQEPKLQRAFVPRAYAGSLKMPKTCEARIWCNKS